MMESDDLDKEIGELQESISAQDRMDFSITVIEHAMQPRNFEEMENNDGYALVRGQCGDNMLIFIKTGGDTIERAAFITDGCGPTLACGSMLTERMKGEGINRAFLYSSEELLEALGGLPPEHEHCAALAVRTLRKAIIECKKRKEGEQDG